MDSKVKRLKDAEDLKIIFPAKLGTYAVELNDAKYNHVNFGAVHAPATDYGDFYFGFWLYILGGQYFWSSGNGGLHPWLGGVSGDAVNGYTISGNVHDANTATTTSFATTEKVPHATWVYVAGWGNGTRLGVSINGVPSVFVSWGGTRRVANGYETIGYLGGSDHQMFTGYVGGLHLYEGTLPYANPHSTVIRPPLDNFGLSVVRNSSTDVLPYFICDLRKGDLVGMLNGKLHQGFFAETLSTGNAGFSDGFSFTPANNRVAANLPQWVYAPITTLGGTAPQKTQISSSRIYYDASGADKNYLTSGTLGGLVARVGNKTWSNANYGQQHGAMFGNSTSPGLNIVTDTATDGTIIFRKPTTWLPLGVSAGYRVIYRYIDANNYNAFLTDEYGSGYHITCVSGSFTTLTGFTFGTGWTEIKLVMAGTTMTVYKDGTEKDSRTVSANAAGTGKGVEFNHPLLRMSEFAVI